MYASLRPRLEAVLRGPLQALAPTPAPAEQEKPSVRLGADAVQAPPADEDKPRPPVLVLYGAVQAMCALGSASVSAEVSALSSQLEAAADDAGKQAQGAVQQAVAEYSGSMLRFALRCAAAAVDGKQWVERPSAPAPVAQPAAPAPGRDAAAGGMSIYGSHAAASTAPVSSAQAPVASHLTNGAAMSAATSSAPPPAPTATATAVSSSAVPETSVTAGAAPVPGHSGAADVSVPEAATAPAPAPAPAAAPAVEDDEEDVEFDL